MFQMSPIATGIYLIAFVGSIWMLIHSYYQHKKNNNKKLIWGVFSCILIVNLIWSLIAQTFIIAGAENGSLLALSRKILTVISLVVAIVLYVYRNRISWFR
jgi:hypothetical protein